MKTFKLSIISIFISLFFTSCTIQVVKNTKSADFTPDYVELNVTMDNYELLGESNVSITYSRYLSLFTFVRSINGETDEMHVKKYFKFSDKGGLKVNRYLSRALYKTHIQYPEADFVVPVNKITEKKNMFLGSTIKQQMKVKVYKLKN